MSDGSVSLMRGKSGIVYGWCETVEDADGRVTRHVYLNGERLNANTMAHEMGHVWVSVLGATDNGYLKRGLELAKRTELFGKIKGYGPYKGMSDDGIAEEVLVRMIADRFEELADKGELFHNGGKESENIIGDLRRWFVGMFRKIKSAFGEWTKEELDSLTLTDVADAAIRDIVSGKTIDEWAAKESARLSMEKLERIREENADKELAEEEVEERINKARDAADAVLRLRRMSGGMEQGHLEYIGNFLNILLGRAGKKGRLRRAFRAYAIENHDSVLPIRMLYEAIQRYQKAVGNGHVR